jgi:hypothetical protein
MEGHAVFRISHRCYVSFGEVGRTLRRCCPQPSPQGRTRLRNDHESRKGVSRFEGWLTMTIHPGDIQVGHQSCHAIPSSTCQPQMRWHAPVMADSSTAALPRVTVPSTGTASPALTRTMAPT